MARFVVFEPAEAFGSDAVAEARIVRDGFSLLGFLVPPVWLLWYGLVIASALAFAAVLALAALAEAPGLGLAASALWLLLSIYVGLEGGALRISALRRRGWREWGALDADTLAEAEIRYAAATGRDAEPEAGLPRISAPQPALHASARHAAGPVLGLLHYPDNV
jgi:hypothetical protein